MSAAISAKSWATLQARASLAGLSVVRTDPVDGPVRVFVLKAGAMRELLNVDDLEALAAHVAPSGY